MTPHFPRPVESGTGISACGLAGAHDTFRRWLGDEYDLDAVDLVLATAAAERLGGDALWILLVSGSGNAKTETVQALAGAGALVTSTLTSEGALLSGTPAREKTKDATGGLLRRLGSSGVLVLKDVTSVISMDRTNRGGVLAALREVHDGKWERNIGTNGGRTLTWTGRIAVVGAVTTAWDRAHDVIASMGDRFVVLRMDSTEGRLAAGRQAIWNTGAEDEMRRDLAAAAGNTIASMDPARAVSPTTDEQERLLRAADLVTLGRTGVEYDYRGDVVDAHAPEMPTRFAKQLTQVMRGGSAIGLDRRAALRLALRCARDSMPPLRLAILLDVAANPGTHVADVRRRLDKPRATVDRQLQALHILNILSIDEKETRWRYTVADGIDPTVLDFNTLPEKLPDAMQERVDLPEMLGSSASPSLNTKTHIHNISGNRGPERGVV